MKCPICGSESKVINTRTHRKDNSIYRRRECLKCGKKFTSYEVCELDNLISEAKKRAKKDAYEEIRKYLDMKSNN